MKLFGNIFKPANKDKAPEPTTISRTQVIDGFSIPAIIRNMQYHLIDFHVYRDGLVFCWEMVDLALFKTKLDNKWVVTTIPDGEPISIFSLGHWTVDKGEWLFTKEAFYDHVYSLIRRLNPQLENLHHGHVGTIEKVGAVEVKTSEWPDAHPYYIPDTNAPFPQRTMGEKFYIFFRDDDTRLYLSVLSIFKDGHVEITNLQRKKSFALSDLRSLIDKKKILTDIPAGERITILGLGSFTVTSGTGVDIEYKYNEFLDKYHSLTGKEASIDKCRRIFDEYKKNPTIQLRDELKEAYEAVPEHQRIFVGDMDSKDFEVRIIIYGDQVKKEWEEYYGYDYPYGEPPKPIDEN